MKGKSAEGRAVTPARPSSGALISTAVIVGLVASLLGGCVLVPVGGWDYPEHHGGGHHHHWD